MGYQQSTDDDQEQLDEHQMQQIYTGQQRQRQQAKKARKI